MSRMSTSITPERSLNILSPLEVQELKDATNLETHRMFRNVALAILNSGSMHDDAQTMLSKYHDFEIGVIQQSRGIKIDLVNAPAAAFVDNTIIRGIKDHLFSALRDIVYVRAILQQYQNVTTETQLGTTDMVFRMLRNSGVLRTGEMQHLLVCWGGHSISREEYDYTKKVGYEVGLRGGYIVTGCGPGAMKGPMKGATIAHAKQHIRDGRYIGLTEPGIVASEPPNPIVNELVILPDIEKRLEAFVRLGHGIIVFPGGVGTAEEILYLLGILLHPKNQHSPFPVVFTAPKHSADYFTQIEDFLTCTLGDSVSKRFKVIIDNPEEVAKYMSEQMEEIKAFRRKHKDAYYFNWLLEVPREFQVPFDPTHENMSKLALSMNQKTHDLASNLRKAFSGIVSGNVKETGIRAIESKGPFKLAGDAKIMSKLDKLLQSFVKQNRMKISSKTYSPCYELIK